MNIDALHKHIDTLLAAIERAHAAQTALPEWKQWEIANALIGEGLYRKLALLGVQRAPDLLHLASIPDDFSEQCKRIDDEIEQKRTPAEREILARYHLKFADQIAGAKERLLQKLERMSENEAA